MPQRIHGNTEEEPGPWTRYREKGHGRGTSSNAGRRDVGVGYPWFVTLDWMDDNGVKGVYLERRIVE